MSTISEILGRRVQLKGLIGKRAVKCPYCDFYFMKNGSDLQRHIWAHEGKSLVLSFWGYDQFLIPHKLHWLEKEFKFTAIPESKKKLNYSRIALNVYIISLIDSKSHMKLHFHNTNGKPKG